jgi:hypothetical protein
MMACGKPKRLGLYVAGLHTTETEVLFDEYNICLHRFQSKVKAV